MLETSKDVLYIVLAFSVLWLTIFLCWLLYYCIKIVRNASAVLDSIGERMRSIEEAIRLIKEKIEGATSSMHIIVDAVSVLIKYAMKRRERKAEEESDDEDLSDIPPLFAPSGRGKRKMS